MGRIRLHKEEAMSRQKEACGITDTDVAAYLEEVVLNRKLGKKTVSLMMCVILGVALAGFGVMGQTLRIASPYTIETLDPFNFTGDGDFYVISQVYETLINLEGDNVIPRLAESWENPDDVTWVFHLREMYWQDGNEVFAEGEAPMVTAHDFVYTLDYLLNPDNNLRRTARLEPYIASYEALDDLTLKIVTVEPSAFFLNTIETVCVVSQQIMEALGDQFADSPIGCGAYEFVENQAGHRVVLRANEDFFIDPAVDEVIFSIIPEHMTMLLALEAGDIDIALQIPSGEVERVLAEDKVTVHKNNVGWYRYMGFNFENPLFEELAVRDAISKAIDMQTIVDLIYPVPGLAEVSWGPIPLGIAGFTEGWEKHWTYDPAAATAQLKDAGWVDTDGDGLLDKDGTPFSFVLQPPSHDKARVKLAVLISTQLSAIGIEAKVQEKDWATHLDDIRSGNVEAFIMGGGSTPTGLLYMFHTVDASGGAHNTRYDNPELDALLDEARRTVDLEKRLVLWRQAAEIVILDRVQIPAYYIFQQSATAKNVVDFFPPNPWVSLCNVYRNVGFEE